MANDTRSGWEIRDDENSISKGREACGNGVTISSTESPDTSSLRRSSREKSSSKKNTTLETPPSKKNMTSSPSSIRKSERIEKRTSTTPPVQSKSERVEKQTESIPLRRSERGKKLSSPSSLDSKKSDKSLGSSEMRRNKEKKEKSVKQLTMETKEAGWESEKQDAEGVRVQKSRIKAHSYRALLKRNKKVKAKDQNKELNRMDKSSQGYSSSCEDDTSEQVNEVRVINSDAEQARMDCSAEENLQSRDLLEYTVESGTLDDDIGLKRGQNVVPWKRKGNEVDMVFDASAVATKETTVCQSDATSLSPTRCPEIRRDKKQRVDSDSTEQEIFLSCFPTSKEKVDRDLCHSSIAEDRGELQVGTTTELAAKCKNQMQQNGFHVNIPACVDENTCLICKRGGKLLCCDGKGCKRSYHISCLDPPLKDFPLGVWHCAHCVKKKIESGVHSLSEGVESIWDAKEVVLDGDGFIRQKEYFVKYKGLAHIHNRWVPESQLLSEVPLLVAKFNRKQQAVRWKQEWTLPHRLLQRRCLTSSMQHDEQFRELSGEDSDCHYEWLVKWHGLGHEHATWELENASFIRSPHGQSLIRDYEDRCKRAKQASSSSIEKEQNLKTSFPVKLSHLSAGCSSGFDNNLECVNKLLDYWHKRKNAIVFDEQDRIVKVVLFILSLLSDVTRPFLIISPSSVLHLWEDEFLRSAPSADVVIYNGNMETRKCIRTSEFYEEGGCIMFQALLTSPEVVIEDLNVFERIGWEVIIIDECQRPKISSHFEQFKMLTTYMRLLLVSGQLKDSISEYHKMLSVLEALGGLQGSNDLMVDANDNTGSLKEKLSKYVAYGGKLDSCTFVEYWIPVQISDVQLEQYCATLLSKSLLLCSPLKHDPVGAFPDILISTRKCCDHPYLVDKSLQSFLVKDLTLTEYLDVGIKASGKLQLLDTMLSEFKNQGSRVLILFQSSGGGRESNSIGDILDDFVRQRFGSDSYERVDGNVLDSKRKSALHNFNNRSERFVFLLETRACRSSIKLSSVHAVIIFHSDWSPMNDLRALQRITLDSQLEQIKVFRLYSSCTVEEKVLILAKQDKTHDLFKRKRDKTPDDYMQNMKPSTSHVLLMWGASYLFNRLDELHSGNIPASSSSNFFEKSLLKDVMQEFLTLLTQTGEDNVTSKLNIILKVNQNQGTYSTTSPLFGESKVEVMDEEHPHVFWAKLLKGKLPRWKYSTCSSQGSRKRVQYLDDLQKKLEVESDEVVKKQKKVVNTCVNQSPLKPGLGGKIFSRDKEGTSALSDTINGKCASASTLANNISKSSRELSYPAKNLHLLLKREMAKVCEVLQLGEDVKDTVEKFFEYVMINHHVNSESATILQAFEISLCWTAASLRKVTIDHKESLALAKQHLNFSCKKGDAEYVYSLLQCLKEVFELSMKSSGQVCSDKQDLFKVAQKDFQRSIRGIKKKCQKQMGKLLQKKLGIEEDINKRYEEEKARLETKIKTSAAVIRYSNGNMKMDRLKILDNEHAKKLEELKHERDVRLKNLEAQHLAALNKLREKETSWVERVKSWLQNELSNKPSSNERSVECVRAVEFQETVPVEVVACSNAVEIVAGPRRLETEGDELDTISSEETSIAGLNELIEAANSGDNQGKEVSLDPCSRDQILDRAMLSMPDGHVQLEVTETVGSSDGAEDCLLPVHSSDREIYENVVPLSVQARTIIEDSPVPSNQALQDECSEPTTSANVQDGDIAAGEIQIASQVEPPLPHPVDAVASNQSNLRAVLKEPVVSRAMEPVVSGVGHQPSSGNYFANQFAQSPTVMFENRNELSNQVISEPVTSSVLNPLTDVMEANSVDSRTGVGISGYINHTVQNAAPVAPWLQHMIPDPLQIELERLRRSTHETIRMLEENKLRLKSDCDREIQEAVTRIRRKYEIRFQEMESEFLLRKLELDANKNKVLMNKIVAMAFRSKWTDMIASSAGMQQGVSSSPIVIHQQLALTLLQHSMQRPVFIGPSGPPAASMQTTAAAASLPRISPAASQHTAVPTSQASPHSSALFSSIPPAASQHTAVPTLQAGHHSSALLSSIPPAASQHTAVPTLQAGPHSSALFSSIPSRPINISPRVSPVSHQVSRGIRAPASHLQQFRPSTPPASTSLPSSILPCLPSNPRPISLHLPQRSLLYSRAPQPESSGVVPSLPNPSQSAMDLLMDFVDYSGANQIPTSSLSLLSEFGSRVPIGQPESTQQNGTRANLAQAQRSEPAAVVCLSDDD